MKKEIKALVSISVICVIVIITSSVVRQIETQEPVSPFSKSFSVFSTFLTPNKPKYTVYGYLPYWGMDKIKYIQLDKLTDLSYFGLNLNADGTFTKYSEDGTTEPGYNNWKNNKELEELIKNAHRSGTRVSLTIISHVDSISDAFLECESCWPTFINQLTNELDYHGIRDVNMNFEYASYTDGRKADQYTKLVDLVNKSLDQKYGDSRVVVAAFADSFKKPRVTKAGDLAKVSDGIFIMAYDFHRPDSDTSGPVAPINGAGVHAEYDISTMLKDYLSSVPSNKIILGVPYYGYNWVVNSNNPGSNRIPGNDYVGYSQSQAYHNIMETVLNNRPKILWDELGQTPYFSYISPETGSIRQVYFDNEQSLRIKYQMAKSNDLAGVGIWALGYDGGYQELWDLLAEEFL